MRYTIILAALMVLLMTPQAARADSGVITSRTGLHAGPGSAYPQLLTLRANTGVNLLSCTRNWGWCEVTAGGLHGWVVSGHMGLLYHGRVRGVGNYGPRLGVPLVVFNEPDYWGKYYYDRDFYIKRYGKHHDNRWSQRDCYDPDHDGDCHDRGRHTGDRDHDWNDDRDDDHNHWRESHDNYHNRYNN